MQHYEFVRDKTSLVVDLYGSDKYEGSGDDDTQKRPLTAKINYSSLQLSEKTSLAGVLGKKNMSFPRKRESSLFDLLENLWIPAFAGMTTFAKGLFIRLVAKQYFGSFYKKSQL